MNMRLLGARTIDEVVPEMLDTTSLSSHVVAVPGDALYNTNCKFLLIIRATPPPSPLSRKRSLTYCVAYRRDLAARTPARGQVQDMMIPRCFACARTLREDAGRLEGRIYRPCGCRYFDYILGYAYGCRFCALRPACCVVASRLLDRRPSNSLRCAVHTRISNAENDRRYIIRVTLSNKR